MGNNISRRIYPSFLKNRMKPKCASRNEHHLNLNSTLENCSHSSTQDVNASSDESEDEFYRFVILHAEEDIEEAIRVQGLLQNEYCIKPGIIFAEMPSGRHLLENLTDAINDSAWIIILLTENFLRDLWCEFQSYTSLFGALTIPHKHNSVIPFRPRNRPLPCERTPFILQYVNILQEDSPGFSVQVKKTFQEAQYRQQEKMWRYGRKKEVPPKIL
uniref:TIR domain-containing adapter molecule 2 n=1 Tax=Micrurus surinamensis TaxID=129470 RepID=A0A2D4NRZ9_MICSU